MKAGVKMKVKVVSIQTFALLFLFGFIFYQYHVTSSLKADLNEANELVKDVQLFETENKQLKSTTDKLKKENEQLHSKLEELLDEKNSNRKIAYLTFDDGPSQNTSKILDTLSKHNINATFFVNGQDSEFALDMYRKIDSEGHTIGNHTYSHNYSDIYKDKSLFFKDFYKLESLLEKTIHKKTTFIRFPGGSNNLVSHQYGGSSIMNEIIADMEKSDYTYTDWNVDSMDASGINISKNTIVHSVLNQSKGKQFVNILMHDAASKTTTAEALPEIIEGLKNQGFEFKNISEHSPLFQFNNNQ